MDVKVRARCDRVPMCSYLQVAVHEQIDHDVPRLRALQQSAHALHLAGQQPVHQSDGLRAHGQTSTQTKPRQHRDDHSAPAPLTHS